MRKNFSNNNFGVAALAKGMGISHSGLHRKLKAISNQSISQFIRETRLKRARELLQIQAGTVAEVAYRVGFGSTTYFSKCFHDHYGYPPGEVKKHLNSEPDSDLKTVHFEIPEKKIKSIAVLPFDTYTGDEGHSISGFWDA